MNWADIAILVIVCISAIISLFRGFVREVLSLAAWVVAFWAAFAFTPLVSSWLAGTIDTPTVRVIVAFLGLLFGALIATGVVTWLIGKLIEKTGLSGTDRMLGVIFGVVRGVAVVLVLVFIAGLTPVPGDEWWQASVFLQHFEQLAWWVISFMPPDMAELFKY